MKAREELINKFLRTVNELVELNLIMSIKGAERVLAGRLKTLQGNNLAKEEMSSNCNCYKNEAFPREEIQFEGNGIHWQLVSSERLSDSI